MKKKKVKILIFLSLFIVLISAITIYIYKITNKEDENIVYINCSVNDEYIEGSYNFIHYYADLLYFLKDDIPKKYNADFFTSNSLIIIKVIEENKYPIIENYEFFKNSISVYLKTKRSKNNESNGWWVLLEIPSESLIDIENVNIYKNEKSLSTNLLNSNIESFISNYDLSDEKKYYQHDKNQLLSNDYLLVYFRKTATCPVLTEDFFGLESILYIQYLRISLPENYFGPVQSFRQLLVIYFQQMNSTKFLEVIKIIEQLEYVKYVVPDVIYDANK